VSRSVPNSRPEPCVTVTDSFLESAADLDRNDAKRVSAFLGKLLAEPAASGLRPEIVNDAHDRTIRSYRVSRELRAVARVEGRDATFLYVGPHEKAYAWAKKHCVECQLGRHTVRLAASNDPARTLRQWECVDRDGLCDVLDAHGVAHELR
jgi:hypothetical protein